LKLKIVIDGNTYEVEVEEAEEPGGLDSSAPTVSAIQSSVLPSAKLSASSDFDEAKVCRSPLAGVVARLEVTLGQHVQPNELLLVLDAMKMEIKIAAQSAVTIKSFEVAPGDAVKPNQVLVCFE
jgi:methylmalonyl-CoA carboxyltransferase small subunit